MGKIEKILKKGPVEGQTTEVYPVTSTKAVYDENNKRLDNIITGLQESVYLNNPIPISTENTPESMAQNVKNIADYVEKAKAAGIADVNGMAVTCLIDDDYSGVGYLYGASIWVTGIITYDETVSPPTIFVVVGDGLYLGREVVIKDLFDQVTSDMLVQGARKPIIFTPSTREVDEETYQKLLSDDVDVMFKDASNVFYYLYDIDKNVSDLEIRFVATLGSIDTTDPSDYWFSVAYVDISKNAPHTVTTTSSDHSLQDIFNDLDYLNKSTLSPVLQEIDLTGTDADRKAKLDQLAVDWKALTGADTLDGARFVGRFNSNNYNSVGLFYFNQDSDYEGISFSDTLEDNICKVVVNPSTGSLTITPLFSHLEAITIQTLNIPANKKKNIDAIQAYVNNLADIGVDVTKGYTIPIKTVGFENGVGVIYPNTPVDKSYKGICIANEHSYIITISKDGTWDKRDLLDTGSDYTVLNTSAKEILSAINEINTLANNKQDTLTSGTNIKTINNQSLLGSGNIEISAPSITVDTTISDTSMNPVQNKVIKAYIDGLVGNVAAQLAQI